VVDIRLLNQEIIAEQIAVKKDNWSLTGMIESKFDCNHPVAPFDEHPACYQARAEGLLKNGGLETDSPNG
jgi:hypothetical protein